LGEEELVPFFAYTGHHDCEDVEDGCGPDHLNKLLVGEKGGRRVRVTDFGAITIK
jgi:hypothetical protein